MHETCDRLCNEFVPPGTEVGLVDVKWISRRIEDVTKEDKTPSICSMVLGFSINSDHGQEPCALHRGPAGVPVSQLLLERNEGLVAINEHGLPEAIELELVGIGKSVRDVNVGLIVV